MGFVGSSYSKTAQILVVCSLAWIASLILNFELMPENGQEPSTGMMVWLGGNGIAMLVLWGLWIDLKNNYEENSWQEMRENERRENWEENWKEQPEIFLEIEKNSRLKDNPSLINIILEYLHFCWFAPIVEGRFNLDKESDAKFIQQLLNEVDENDSYYKFGDFPGCRHREMNGIVTSDSLLNMLEILYTIANACGIQKKNGLEYYSERLYPSEELAHLQDVPEGPNFENYDKPSIELLEKCRKINSSLNQGYEIRDLSSFDTEANPLLASAFNPTLRYCIFEILNTNLTEEIIVTLRSRTDTFSEKFDDEVKQKFLSAMIIEIWAICGGLKIEKKFFADLGFNLGINSMQKEMNRPESAFRTKKSKKYDEN